MCVNRVILGDILYVGYLVLACLDVLLDFAVNGSCAFTAPSRHFQSGEEGLCVCLDCVYQAFVLEMRVELH